MSTAGLGQGNASPVAKFNVYKDAEAYKVMLDSGIDITIVGFDICETDEALFSGGQLAQMEQGNDALRFVARSNKKFLEHRLQTQGLNSVDSCDAILMGCLIWPDFIVDGTDCKASCITHDSEAFGQVIFYRTEMAYDSMPDIGHANTRLITALNLDHYYENVVALFSGDR